LPGIAFITPASRPAEQPCGDAQSLSRRFAAGVIRSAFANGYLRLRLCISACAGGLHVCVCATLHCVR
jgi:hypothetical protein